MPLSGTKRQHHHTHSQGAADVELQLPVSENLSINVATPLTPTSGCTAKFFYLYQAISILSNAVKLAMILYEA